MARKINSEASSSNNASVQFKKADAFVNLYVTEKSGRRSKVGAIALHLDSGMGARLIPWLDANEGNAQALLKHLTVQYVRVDANEAAAPFELAS